MKDIISIIVPCYNVEKYILRCLNSIKNQTYGFENIELILIDDASTDNTPAFLEAFAETNKKNVKLIKLSQNGKQGAARNKGMDLASGKYLMFVDSDDAIDATMLEKMHSKIVEFDCDEVRCGMKQFSYDKEMETHRIGVNNSYHDLTNEAERKTYILSAMSCVVPSRLFKREVLEKNNLRFLEGVFYEDAHFSGICCFYINSRYWLDEDLYYYYRNPSSTMRSFSFDRNRDHITVANKIFEELKERNIYDSAMQRYYHELNAYYFWMIYLNPLVMMMNAQNDEIRKYKEEVLKNCPDIMDNAYVRGITSTSFLKCLDYLK